MQLGVMLAFLTVAAAIQSAMAAEPPEAAATPDKVASEAVQAPAPAPPTASSPATASSTSAPATAPATASPAEDSDAARLEKRMHARGYTTRMQNGEKVFCHREQVLGTRLGGSVHCMTADEARVNETRMQQDEELLRQRMMGTCLPNGTGKGANCGG